MRQSELRAFVLNPQHRATAAALDVLRPYSLLRPPFAARVQTAGLALKVEPYALRVPRSQRGGEIVEPLVREQWFVTMQPLAKPALQVSGRMRDCRLCTCCGFAAPLLSVLSCCLLRRHSICTRRNLAAHHASPPRHITFLSPCSHTVLPTHKSV